MNDLSPPERLAALLLVDPEAAEEFLTEEERQAYRDAQESVVRARDEAQRWGATHWIF